MHEVIAGIFQITPLRIILSKKNPIAVLTVTNKGELASVMQLKVMSWAQEMKDDTYFPTNEVLVTPPIFSIAPKSSQIIRIGMQREPDGTQELAYRLFLQEIPKHDEQSLIKMTLSFGIPIFIPVENNYIKPMLNWRVIALQNGNWLVEAANQGSVHVQVVSFKLLLSDGSHDITAGEHSGMNYILSGNKYQWLIHTSQTKMLGKKIDIIAKTDMGEIYATAKLEN